MRRKSTKKYNPSLQTGSITKVTMIIIEGGPRSSSDEHVWFKRKGAMKRQRQRRLRSDVKAQAAKTQRLAGDFANAQKKITRKKKRNKF